MVWAQRRSLRLFRVAVEEGHFQQGKLAPGLAHAEVGGPRGAPGAPVLLLGWGAGLWLCELWPQRTLPPPPSMPFPGVAPLPCTPAKPPLALPRSPPPPRPQVNLHAMTAGVAVLSLYAWLVSLRQLLAKHGVGTFPLHLAIVTDRGKGAKEQGNLVVKEAVQAMLAGWGAPFK